MTKVVCLAVPLAVTLSLGAGAALAAEPQVRIGTAPQLPGGTTLVAGSASLQTMQITVALAPRDPAALRSYAEGVGDPTLPITATISPLASSGTASRPVARH